MRKRQQMLTKKQISRLITEVEMSYPDSKARFARARKESKAGKGISLEQYLKKRKNSFLRKAA